MRAPARGSSAARGHDWPGNVRELRNVLERAVALAGPDVRRFEDLPISVGRSASPPAGGAAELHEGLSYKLAKERVVAAWEREYLRAAWSGRMATCRARRATWVSTRVHLRALLRRHGLVAD